MKLLTATKRLGTGIVCDIKLHHCCTQIVAYKSAHTSVLRFRPRNATFMCKDSETRQSCAQ